MFLLSRRLLLTALLAASTAPAGAAEERRILVFGDSQAQGLAAGLIRAFRTDREVRVLDRSRIGTGLSRPAFDWAAQAKTLADTERARVAVCMFGANDRPPMRATGEAAENLLAGFTDTYAARITAVAQPFQQARIPLIWVGHPVVRDPAYAEDLVMLNDLFAGSELDGALFLSSWELFRGPDGQYASHGAGLNGATQRLRADDGVHLTPAGYDVLAASVLPDVFRFLGQDASRQ